MPSSPSFTLPTAGDSRAPVQPRESRTRSRNRSRERFFSSLPRSTQFRPQPAARKIRRSARKSRGRERIVEPPLSKHSTRPASDQRHLSSVPRPPTPFCPAGLPRSFSPSLPLAAGKAGNPKKWTVGFRRRRGAAHTRRNSFSCTSAQRTVGCARSEDQLRNSLLPVDR